MTDSKNNELRISLRDLPRSIGSRRSEQIQWVVPNGFGTSTMHVPVGTQVLIDLNLTAIDHGVVVDAAFDIEFIGDCVRCLNEVRRVHHVDTSDVYREPLRDVSGSKQSGSKKGEKELDDLDDVDQSRQIGPHDTIDLEPFLRDSVIPLVDLLPLCSDDCMGLCMICGEMLVDLPAGHEHDVIDPRFTKLSSLFGGASGSLPVDEDGACTGDGEAASN